MSESIKIKLFADLDKQFRASVENASVLDKPSTVGKILTSLSIPEEKVRIIFLNGKHAELDSSVTPGDTLSLFPPIGGG